jgi:drug/metabolite transporter (DMT)-like permease
VEGARTRQPDLAALLAFVALVLLVGANLVAIRFSNRELAPLWGAAVRFALAAVIFGAIVVARRLPLPKGRALAGAAAYGLLGFAAYFAFLYWGLVEAPAGLGQIVLALVPLLTMLLAAAQGLEGLQWRALVGAIIAVAGIAIVYGGQAHANVPFISLLALIAAAACFAETGIVVKRLPPADPVATNAVATTVGAAVLLALSLITGEPRVVPAQGATWAALAYVVTLGTVVVFLLFLFLIKRWRASSVSYQFVLAPFVAVALASTLAGEAINLAFVVGGALVLTGVFVGVLMPVKHVARPAA